MVHCNFFVNAVYDHYYISELRLSDCSRARLNFQAFDVDAVVATIYIASGCRLLDEICRGGMTLKGMTLLL
jgi:hypothetical protein